MRSKVKELSSPYQWCGGGEGCNQESSFAKHVENGGERGWHGTQNRQLGYGASGVLP